MQQAGISFICVLPLFAALADAQQNKPNLSGKWQLNSSKSELHTGKSSGINLIIEQSGASIHVVRTTNTSDGKQAVMDFHCTTNGKDCDTKGTKVSLWYDGTSLVEMDITAEVIIKNNMTLAPDGKSISITVTYISPEADADKLVLDKT
jgi:hypothetical protein